MSTKSNLPVQLELLLVTDKGKLSDRNAPCKTAIASLSRATLTPEQRFILPGLDADLCRCPQCSARAAGGVWWFSQQMRDWLRTRNIPYNFAGAIGDVAIEAEG